MVSDLKKLLPIKGCEIAAQQKVFFGEFCHTSRMFLVSVLLSASVERCFVSLMCDFFTLSWGSQLAPVPASHNCRDRRSTTNFFSVLKCYSLFSSPAASRRTSEGVPAARRTEVLEERRTFDRDQVWGYLIASAAPHSAALRRKNTVWSRAVEATGVRLL